MGTAVEQVGTAAYDIVSGVAIALQRVQDQVVQVYGAAASNIFGQSKAVHRVDSHKIHEWDDVEQEDQENLDRELNTLERGLRVNFIFWKTSLLVPKGNRFDDEVRALEDSEVEKRVMAFLRGNPYFEAYSENILTGYMRDWKLENMTVRGIYQDLLRKAELLAQ